jgi:hypothetical protein
MVVPDPPQGQFDSAFFENMRFGICVQSPLFGIGAVPSPDTSPKDSVDQFFLAALLKAFARN